MGINRGKIKAVSFTKARVKGLIRYYIVDQLNTKENVKA